MKAADILLFWQARDLALAPSEGFRVGVPDGELTGVLVCWLPTGAAIAAARRLDCNLIIARDQFNFPPDYSGALIDHNLSDKVTLRRLRALTDAGIGVFRAHSSLDEIVLDSFAQALGLPEPEICGSRLRRIYHLAAMPARQLAAQVKERMGVDTLRVCGDLRHSVRRVALLWGNTGCAHNPHGLEPLLHLHPDVLITGETDEYPLRAALDAGIAVIEVGHARSVAPGLRRFAAMLRGQFPGLRVEFYENPRPWVLV
jgi:putative NIF3 family GTP cyclohydrolase 1 type 2